MIRNHETEQPPYLLWELIDETGRVLCSVEQLYAEYETNGATDALALLLPLEHFPDADVGEWDENEFTYRHKGKIYVVRGKVVPEEMGEVF